MSALGTNIPCGSLFGIPIKINILLPVFVAFQCLILIRAGADGVLWGALVFGPILFATVLVHEIGHSLAARSVGGKAVQIILWPLGGLAFITHEAGPVADLWVTLAGPLTHIPQAGIWYIVSLIMGSSGSPHRPVFNSSQFAQSLVGTAFWMNIGLMLFNLLCPAYPLDGGRILVDLLLIVGVPAKTTAWITIIIAVIVAVALVIMTVIFQYFGFGGILIAVFILFSTFGLWQYLQRDQIEQHPLFKKASESDNPAASMLPKDDGPPPAVSQV